MGGRRTIAPGIGLGCVVALLCASSAGAATASFGADLAALPANNDLSSGTCATPPRQDAPTGSPSCMWSYIDTAPNTLTAPATGTVTAVRVKVGATTGPMRVNVIRFLFQQGQNPSYPVSSGPYLEAYGPEFTPAANTVSTVPTNLRVQEDPTPPPEDKQTVQVIDTLALEVEAPNVPIPLFRDDSALSYPVYPGPTAQGRPAPSANGLPSYTRFGVGVLMNADLTTGGGGGGGPTHVPTVALRNGTVPVRRGVATIPLQCRVADCTGLLSLLKATGRARTAARKPTSYGSARFRTKAGRTTKVKVRLNRAGRSLLRHRRRVTVAARVRFTSGGGKTKSFRITLKR